MALSVSVVIACRVSGEPAAAAKASPAREGSPPGAESGPFVPDALWQEARRGADIEWQRLANREGVSGLVPVATRQDEWGIVAIRCLPYAEDALQGLDFLCQAAQTGVGTYERAVLEALHAILAEPPRDTEEETPDDVRVCRERLASVVDRGDLRPAEHDLASSALRMSNERVRHR